MKRLKYMAVNHTLKEDHEFKIVAGLHCCGCRMMFCTTCHRIFCTSCDFIPGKVDRCCSEAIGIYCADNERKIEKREAIKREMAKRPKKMARCKFKIQLEEIPCDNIL